MVKPFSLGEQKLESLIDIDSEPRASLSPLDLTSYINGAAVVVL
jgi:hypothetical protein